MTDFVKYARPFGFAEKIVHAVVNKQLKKIFGYRYKKIEEIFGEWKDQEMNLRFD